MPSPVRAALTTVALVGIALMTSACGTTPADPGSTSPSPSVPPSSTATPPTPSPTTPATGPSIPADVAARPAVQAAIEDAAGRQSVIPDQVDIATFTPVTWNDGSLGCPKEGMSYTQATIEGELLILRVGTALLQYHGRVGGPYTYCAAPTGSYSVG